MTSEPLTAPDFPSATGYLEAAAAAEKCRVCGCLRNSLPAIEQTLDENHRPSALAAALQAARSRLLNQKYDCLGCPVCYPAAALNALGVEGNTCSDEAVPERAGWPPLPGSYNVFRFRAPVAVCCLTNERLAAELARTPDPAVAIAGTLQTENLGIERLVSNVVANPNIRFLVVCGADSHHAVGHYPGQSLVALARFGVDPDGRIIEAKGRNARLRNLPGAAIDHFRQAVEVLDLIGNEHTTQVLAACRDAAGRDPGLAQPFAGARMLAPVKGCLPRQSVPDPAGYFVVYVDRARAHLLLEHYQNDGLLDVVIEGVTATELYYPAIERGLVSRLDHSAYLGQELARAEHSLRTGETYVQDAAPVRPESTCGCGRSCSGGQE